MEKEKEKQSYFTSRKVEDGEVRYRREGAGHGLLPIWPVPRYLRYVSSCRGEELSEATVKTVSPR